MHLYASIVSIRIPCLFIYKLTDNLLKLNNETLCIGLVKYKNNMPKLTVLITLCLQKSQKSSFVNNENLKNDVFEGKKLNTMTPAKIVV